MVVFTARDPKEEETPEHRAPEQREHLTEWLPHPVDDTLIIALEGDRPVVQETTTHSSPCLWLIPWRGENGRKRCLLVCRRDLLDFLRVNGLPALSLTVLDDRDEIAVGTAPVSRFFFSQESKAEVVPFKEGSEPVYCARSKSLLTEGVLSVRCPRCGLWYVETEEIPAYSYHGQPCLGPGCGRPPVLGYAWKPEPIRLPATPLRDRYRKVMAETHGTEKKKTPLGKEI